METITTAIQSLTILEIILIISIIIIIHLYITKLYLIDVLNKNSDDLRVANNQLYYMYKELSNSTMDLTKKWNNSIEHAKSLSEKLFNQK